MKTYRLKIEIKSTFLTPWQADTIFGSLCWIIAWRKGEDGLRQFLDEYREGTPPFILSDGLPGDLLPAPAHLALSGERAKDYEEFREGKELKKIEWLDPETFKAVRQGELTITPDVADLKAVKAVTTLHSTINRITGTTGDKGSLYELQEFTHEQEYISIYLKIRDGQEDLALSLFKDLSLTGYGKKKSVGKGAFEIIGELESFNGFDDFEGANGYVALSNFVPAKSDPTVGYYKTMVKYGKLGGEYAFCGKPFKKPLVMLTAGSSFKTSESIKPFYGRMIEEIAPAKPEVVHYGYAFAVPIIMKA